MERPIFQTQAKLITSGRIWKWFIFLFRNKIKLADRTRGGWNSQPRGKQFFQSGKVKQNVKFLSADSQFRPKKLTLADRNSEKCTESRAWKFLTFENDSKIPKKMSFIFREYHAEKNVQKLLTLPIITRGERFGIRRFLDHLAKSNTSKPKHFGNHRRRFPTWPTGRPLVHTRVRDTKCHEAIGLAKRGAYLDN